MRIVLPTLCLLLASGAFAASAPEGLPTFGAVNFAQARAAKFGLPSPRSRPNDVLTSYHMIIQAGKDSLYGYADNDVDAAEAVSYWSAALKSAGVRPGASTFSDGMYRIPYATSDGRVIRDFLADSRQFPPKDEAGLRANMEFAKTALAKQGLTVAAANVVNVDALLPTYSILYLTKADDQPEHETRLRVLKPGDDFDFGVFRAAGVTVVQTPETWMMVYIGPEVGYVSLLAKTQDDIDQKVAKRREFLSGAGKTIIAERRVAVDSADLPDYKFGASLYFFQ